MSTEGFETADMSDVSVSESSWADAQADTPTMGEGGSDSEDTLSNLSFDNDAEGDNPDELGTPKLPGGSSGKANNGQQVNVHVRINDTEMEEDSLHLDLPPGTTYNAPTVDFPTSPSQLKISKGPSFMPTEEPGVISEDESSVNSYRAHLGLNGDVRLTKREDEHPPHFTPPPCFKPSEHIPSFALTLDGEPESLLVEDQDAFDDYMEDFFFPLSNEPVMQRATSFRRKVQKQFEDAYTEKSIREINNLEAMLSAYDSEDVSSSSPNSNNKCSRGVSSSTPKCACADVSKCDCMKEPGGADVSAIGNGSENGEYLNGGDIIPSTANSTQSNYQTPPSKEYVDLYDPITSLNEKVLQRNVTYGRGNEAFKERRFINKVKRNINFEDEEEEEPQSLLDIDAIVRANAPNLMNSLEPQSLQLLHQQQGDEETSNFFLTKETLNKIESVFDSNNFNNLYTLTGELKHMLSPTEIEELVANKEQLAQVLDPNVMAALMSWSLNDTSLPPPHNGELSLDQEQSLNYKNTIMSSTDLPVIIEGSKDDGSNNCFSSATSLSNGFHSKESSLTDVSDQNELDEAQLKQPKNLKKTVPVRDCYNDDSSGNDNNNAEITPDGSFQRGVPATASFRRKIALAKEINRSDIPQRYEETEEMTPGRPDSTMSSQRELSWRSAESLVDLGVVEDDATGSKNGSENGEDEEPKMILVRRDSKRYAKGDGSRIIQGLFIESKGTHSKGTLRKIRVPLNFDECTDDNAAVDSPTAGDADSEDAKTPKSHKKRISVDDHILSTASEVDDNSCATDVTRSDVFHSIINSPLEDDRTIRSDLEDVDDEDVTLDIDTPDDMEESILEQLESIATTPVAERIPELSAEEEMEDERRWKSFRVGANDIHIDLKAIQPYRRVLSHGGYFDAEKKVAIILFSGCFLPDRSRKEYSYLMDHLFLYVLSSLEELIVEDYILVYLHGATPKSCVPTFNWLKRCYQLIDHRLRKNLKGLYLVHPTFWLKAVVACTKPFVSSKFSRKLQFVNTLADLCLLLPTEHLVIPDRVLHYDFEMKLEDLKRQNKLS